MTPDQRRDLLIRAGRTLYGERWQTPLSHDLRCNDRTVRRWASGESEVPWGVLAELRGVLMARSVSIDEIVAEMETGRKSFNRKGLGRPSFKKNAGNEAGKLKLPRRGR